MYKELGFSPRSVEANELLKMTDVINQIHSLFEEASVDAAQNYQAASEEGVNKQSEEIKKQAKQDVNPYQGKTMYINSDIYNYEFLISLDPMKVETMPSLSVVSQSIQT